MVKVRNVVWDQLARAGLKIAFNYIRKDSLQRAQKVEADIFAATSKLSDQPKMYPVDKQRTTEDDRFRAFEMHSYRISYEITDKVIIVLRVRHVKQEPKKY